jgi:hypothetical protein
MINKMSRSSMNTKTWYRSMLAGNTPFDPGSYELITSAYGTGSSGTITFSSIPQTYKHLQVRYTAKTSSTLVTLRELTMQVNSTTSINTHYLFANGGGVSASYNTSTFGMRNMAMTASDASMANSYGVGIIDILDYANTNKNKTIRAFSGNTPDNQVYLTSGLYISTAAITDLSFKSIQSGETFPTATRFSLYGIKG